jgi:hypothetical protein
MGEGVHGSAPGPSAEEPRSTADDDGGMYGVFGEGKPRHIVGDSDEPPRRRPRKKVHEGPAWLGRPVEG